MLIFVTFSQDISHQLHHTSPNPGDSEQRRYNFIADHYPGAGEREKLSVIAECEQRLRISADGALHESSGFSQQAVPLDRAELSAEFIERYSLSGAEASHYVFFAEFVVGKGFF